VQSGLGRLPRIDTPAAQLGLDIRDHRLGWLDEAMESDAATSEWLDSPGQRFPAPCDAWVRRIGRGEDFQLRASGDHVAYGGKPAAPGRAFDGGGCYIIPRRAGNGANGIWRWMQAAA
jgi:hypothetical protein